jgi:peroxin-12
MSHLSGQDQADKPSLFELIAQDQMRDLLRPALRYLLTASIHSFPIQHVINLIFRFIQRDIQDIY